MEPSTYEIVYGPRGPITGASVGALVDRALVANVVMARACALSGDMEGEALHHQEINALLDRREPGDAGDGPHDSNEGAGASFEPVDSAELDDEQRRWLPDPIPADLRVLRCTACGQMRAEIPERGVDPWKDHSDECDGEPDEDDDW